MKIFEAQESPFAIILMTAALNSDPETETDPVVELTFSDITQPLTGPFNVNVAVNALNHVVAIYESLLGRIAGASFVTPDRGYVPEADTADFEIAPTGHDGEVGLYTTVYDHNKNRVFSQGGG